MRSTTVNFSVMRYATMSWNTTTNVLKNDVLTYEGFRLDRSDVLRTEGPIVAEWRPPLPYFARSWGADCMDIDFQCHSPGSPVVTYVARGKLGIHTATPTLQVTEEEIKSYMPSANDISASVIIARNNVADRAASFAESFVEAKKTIFGLGENARKIDTFLARAVRKDWRGAAKALGIRPADRRHKRAVDKLKATGETVSNAWLYYNFGIAPIVSDMVSACILLGGLWNFRVTGKTVFLTSGSSDVVTVKRAIGYVPGNVAFDQVTNIRAGVHTRLDYELRNSYLQGFAKFGVTDVAQAAWAVVPHSFLVDFVLPVSTVLRSLTATLGLDWKGGSSTPFVQIDKRTANARVVDLGTSILDTFSAIDTKVSARMMDRKVYQEEPNPVTLWLKDPFDVFKAVTSFAVLGQRLSNLFSKS